MTEVDYLCSMWVHDAAGEQLHLWATPAMLVLDRNVNVKRGDPIWERLRTIPISEIKSIDVEEISPAISQMRWKATTGFLGRGSQTPATTGVLVILTSGEHLLFRVQGLAPIEVRALLGRLIALVGT
jgi:hypothetical protein